MRAAMQFLTILPVPAPAVPPGAPAAWFPLVGALLGALVSWAWYTPFPAVLALVTAVVLTGGLHEDGLADIADAVRAGRPRERMLEILKDSRIGVYGALAIGLSLLVRLQALDALRAPVWPALALAFAASRGSMVLLAWATPAAAPGLGQAFRGSLPRWAPAVVAIQLVAESCFVPAGPWALLAVILSVAVCRAWFLRRLGGITGDALGFQCQVAECLALLVLAWR